jgi:ribosomal protein L37AE/L43A
VTASTVQTGSRPVGSPDAFRLLATETKMSDNRDHQLPVWAHRLRKSQIERLYNSCGKGRLDEELIDDVGFSLYARCTSMLQVSEAIRGRPPCPNCGATAQLHEGPPTFAKCRDCGWTCPWALYKKTYQRKGLFAGGMESFVRDFVQEFAAARSHRERLVLIDTLIHRFHWESGDRAAGRPGASSLIEGKMKDIMAFLDRLSYGDDIPPEVAHTREEWRRKWRGNPWSSGRGQGS